ncbi:MAG: PPC domain-containing protein [Phycisphaerae bacterium]|nr:PPC domain-containing protein [Phycisphaerae bacterium]
MTVRPRLMLLAAALCASTAWGQSNSREPHIGYIYPAGGQRGATFEIWVGGQFLQGVTDAYVSGKGVHASIIQHYRPLKNIDKEQRDALQRKMKEVRDKRLAEASEKGKGPAGPRNRFVRRRASKPSTNKADTANLPNHPLLRDIDDMSLRELEHLRHELLNIKKRQQNAQIAETVVVKVTIDPGAALGDRELRLLTRAGLTNPMCFQVGAMPETRELESNDPKAYSQRPPDPPVDLPVLLNGQIKPGDVDRFRFRAKAGQRLVIEAYARRLVPYLADAVPGWFQATLALYDAAGNEVAFEDDYRFDPDPVLFYKIPSDGVFELEIRDAIYRGREDFVYRIAVGEQPFITQAFPLGARTGSKAVASVEGWNLARDQVTLRTQPGGDRIRETALRQDKWLSNPVTYAVERLPECDEAEPDDTTQKAQRVDLPRVVNGRIDKPGDVDVFRFDGRGGDEVVAEVLARRLGSPLDSLLQLTDASGRVLAWNDDQEDKASGLLTHHADSYCRFRLPADGTYYVRLADSQRHGGKTYAYRLRIGPPRPDFELRMTPSSISVPAGRAAAICVYAFRKDGFNGDIDVVLKDAPSGFKLSGGQIPSGRDRVRMTLAAPWRGSDEPIVLNLEGRARVGGTTISRPVVPAEDMMQAFLYRHLVPSQELMVVVRGQGRRGPPVELAGSGPIRVPQGGATQVRIRAPKHPMLRNVQLELNDPPDGMSLQDVKVVPEGLAFALKADEKATKVGLSDNLIVEVFTEMPGGQRGGKGAKQKRRVSLGVIPAIPFEVVQR